MNPECLNCHEPIKRGMLCNPCAAVTDICTHFTAYAYNPRELSELIKDLRRNNVVNGQGLLDLGLTRGALQMQGLGRKCIESERVSGGTASVFLRALKLLEREQQSTSQQELDALVEQTTAATKLPREREEAE